ncbi:MAG: DUF192 domain-containing protein [Candidatus Woesearchaeota archaeon]
MKIINKTKNYIISNNCIKYNSILLKAIGLMFSKKKDLLFFFKKEQIIPLHMFFVFFTIDVLFVDKNYKIVEIKKNFKPFSYYKPKNPAKYIIEISKKKLKNTKINDLLEFKK